MCYASSVGESFLDDNAFSRSILFFLHLGNPLFPSLSISWNQCHEGRPYMLCLFSSKCRGDPRGRPSDTCFDHVHYKQTQASPPGRASRTYIVVMTLAVIMRSSWTGAVL